MMIELLIALLMVVGASIIISYACNGFDEASSYLGRHMKPGVRGATINAVGSSLPELFTAFFLLFWFQDQGGFSAGIATTAGSAVFNAVVIPMACIFVVAYRGVGRMREKVTSIVLDKPNIMRDAVFLLLAEIVLIVFLGGSALFWWMGLGMMFIYLLYFLVLMRGFGSADEAGEEDGEDNEDSLSDVFERNARKTRIKALMTFDFNALFFKGRPFNDRRAWVVLSFSVLVISIACYALAEAVIISANSLGVPAYFTAVILAAAASSVPDTILSVKDAVKGDYDDALSNALGSNIFDITVALGLPLMVYGLMYGVVPLGSAVDGGDQIQVLRIVLVGVTLAVLAALLLTKSVGVKTAWFFCFLYLGWVGYIIYTAAVQAGWM